MSYEVTGVDVLRSQAAISGLVAKHGGTGIGFESEPPEEAFTVKIRLGGHPYIIRVAARTKSIGRERRSRQGAFLGLRTEAQMSAAAEQERRRVWRVLYWHLKAVFDAADAGVIELRRAMLPYIVMANGQTVGEVLLPRLDAIVAGSDRLLPAAPREAAAAAMAG